MSGGSTATVHYFNAKEHAEVVKVLVEFSSFILTELQKPEPLTADKLSMMVNLYINNCMYKGPPQDSAPPEGAVCKHTFSKGQKSGTECGKNAKYIGVDGLPKCSSHRFSKPTKTDGPISNTPTTASTGQTFSYSENQGKGKTIPQSMTSIQATIFEQQSAAELKLSQTQDGIYFHDATRLVFENRGVDKDEWIAVGCLIDGVVNALTQNDTYVCFGNQWKWDPDKCVKANDTDNFVSSVPSDHPLLSSGTNGLIQKKLEHIASNSNN